MWFGDLVTMKWWDDLWLNESFAEWASHHAMVEATEYTEAWTGFTNARKNWAYRQDQLPSTHPIAADNHDLEAVEVNFDGITYAKGASTLKQLVAWVGIDEFLVGLRDYFKTHAFSNSEFSDLLGSLEKTSGRELDSWAEEWLQTSGVNTLAPRFEVGADGAYTRSRVAPDRRAGVPDPAPAPDRRRPLRPRRRPPRPAYVAARSTSRATHTDVPELVGAAPARPAAAQRRRPHLRQDPPRRAVAGHRRGRASTRSTTRWPARCCGARPGT